MAKFKLNIRLYQALHDCISGAYLASLYWAARFRMHLT